MLEVFLLQQYNIINLCMYACVSNYTPVEVHNLAKDWSDFRIQQSLFILSIPPTWRPVVSDVTSLHLLTCMC